MKKALLLGALLLGYASLVVPFASYLKARPVAIKLGYMPEGEAVRVVAADQRYLLAQIAIDRVLFYYGSLLMPQGNRMQAAPEYFNMFTTLQGALKLDPYNQDAYYFAQAAFTWELRRIKEVNNMLDYGMRYRTWDGQLPFYAGFNAAYFNKDYQSASRYMKKAAEITGNPLFTTLAARYFYQAGQTALGVAFLTAMEKGAKDPKIRKIYRVRRIALEGMQVISEAVERYRVKWGHLPPDLPALVSAGVLERIPADPYGGRFYLDPDGQVLSTSSLSANGGSQGAGGNNANRNKP